MLVPTMTPEEIYAEIYKDAEWLEDKVNIKLAPQTIKLIKRAKRFPFIKSYSVKRKETQIEYNIVFFAYQRGDWNRPSCFIYTKYTHESGRTLVYLERDRFAIRIYTPHFMQRFKERNSEFVSEFSELANLDLEFFFLLRNWDVREMKFFTEVVKDNPNSVVAKKIVEQQERTKFHQDTDYERYSVACLTGMCLCERHKQNKNISIFDTFISVELLKGDQHLNFLPAYAEVFLNAVCRVYTRQKELIMKEWNGHLDSCEGGGFDKVLCTVEKLKELADRYPLPPIF